MERERERQRGWGRKQKEREAFFFFLSWGVGTESVRGKADSQPLEEDGGMQAAREVDH